MKERERRREEREIGREGRGKRERGREERRVRKGEEIPV